MNFFYTSSSGSIGPVSKEDLVDLYRAGQLQPDTMVIEETGSEWKPLVSIIRRSVSSKLKKVAREMRAGTNTVFTIKNTDRLTIMPMPVKKVAPHAVILQDYGMMPDGSQRKVLVIGKDIIPSTPEEALKQYIPSQEARIEDIKEVLRQEENKLEQAKKLLNQKKSRRTVRIPLPSQSPPPQG